jgi:hypothetical protein
MVAEISEGTLIHPLQMGKAGETRAIRQGDNPGLWQNQG